MDPKPEPVVTGTACSLCGLDWRAHGDAPTALDCIRLLKADTAASGAVPDPASPAGPAVAPRAQSPALAEPVHVHAVAEPVHHGIAAIRHDDSAQRIEREGVLDTVREPRQPVRHLMAAGDITQGRARDGITPPWELAPGDYCVRVDAPTGKRMAWVVTPNGNGPARLEGWDLAEHEDGTITTSPSILAHAVKHMDGDGTVRDIAEWHGFLERGVWREA